MHCNSFLVFIFICCLKDVWTQDCPQHWAKHGFSCYLFIKDVPGDFMKAKSICQQHGSKLVEIETADENNFLRSHIVGTHPQNGYWIGLSDIAKEGEWVWPSTGSVASFYDWARSPVHQPDNLSNQDCAMFFTGFNFHWDDNTCTVKAGFICEIETGLLVG
ncbi:perlucin-like protein [Saccostrea cucullata]|uniref:perlucin-like protein n=1 Tax=Saccostrea cuccullata TaxID=36930 RepID=UPI002ED5072A